MISNFRFILYKERSQLYNLYISELEFQILLSNPVIIPKTDIDKVYENSFYKITINIEFKKGSFRRKKKYDA